MANLAITKIGRPVLRKKTKTLSAQDLARPEIRRLIQDMVDTMHQAEGVGLAANQVDQGLCLCVMECLQQNSRYPEAPFFALETWINPQIVQMSQEMENGWEGCLSIPGYRGIVPRAKWVVFEALTPDGKAVRKKLEGFHARVLQHEVDHLNGFFYMDRMLSPAKAALTPECKLEQWLHLEETGE